MKKKWYDALWIASLAYLALGFFNILFAWLGLLCFFIPLFIAVAKGTKGYCNRYCGRGQLLSLLGGRLGLSQGKDPEKVEQQLRKILPPEESSDFCHRIVLFGRDICTARSPKCQECPL